MALPIDTTKLSVLCGAPPSAVIDRDSGEQRTNRDGEALFRTELVVIGAGRPEVLGVRTTREPKGLAIGSPVNVIGFTVSTFVARDGGTGVFYEAAAIEPTKTPKETL